MRRFVQLWRVMQFVFVRAVWVRIAGGLGHLRRQRQIIEDFPAGGGPAGSQIALFAHFDRNGEVRPHVVTYLAALQAAGFSIVFVTNSGRLTQAARSVLMPLCARVIVRRNRGYDFGAWRDGLDRCGLLAPDVTLERLLLANDSVYGPLFPLNAGLSEDVTADVLGLTESWQAKYHLQSYFLLLSGRVLRDPAWPAFWATVRPAPSKALVVLRYEVGLTQALLRAGFSVGARFGYGALLTAAAQRPALGDQGKDDEDAGPAELSREKQRLRILRCAAARVPLNPTSDLWRELLAAGCPFVKRELLRDNPTEVHDVADLLACVRAAGADTGPLERDLRRVLRRTSP